MEKIALFPGSFDPFTLGHKAVVSRAIPLFDKIIVAIGVNSEKKSYFPLEQRKEWIKEIFKESPQVEVQQYSGMLTVEYCKKIGASYILRGLRIAADFEYERTIAHANFMMYPEIETIFLLAPPELSSVTSTVVREIIKYGGNADVFLPAEIVKDLPLKKD